MSLDIQKDYNSTFILIAYILFILIYIMEE